MADFEGEKRLNRETSELEVKGKFKLSEEELDNVAGGCGDDENHEVWGGWAPCEHYSKEANSYGGKSTDRCALCWYFHARSGDPGARDQAGDCYYRD